MKRSSAGGQFKEVLLRELQEIPGGANARRQFGRIYARPDHQDHWIPVFLWFERGLDFYPARPGISADVPDAGKARHERVGFNRGYSWVLTRLPASVRAVINERKKALGDQPPDSDAGLRWAARVMECYAAWVSISKLPEKNELEAVLAASQREASDADAAKHAMVFARIAAGIGHVDVVFVDIKNLLAQRGSEVQEVMRTVSAREAKHWKQWEAQRAAWLQTMTTWDAAVFAKMAARVDEQRRSVDALRAVVQPAVSANLGIKSLVVVERHFIRAHHIYGYHTSGQKNGGGLCVFTALPSGWEKRCIVDAADGQINRCDLSFDGKEIVFNWRVGGARYHVYRVNVDGSGLTQLTQGPHHNYDACWLPDGGIAFLSTRSDIHALCHDTPMGTLHRMDRDGSNVVSLTSGNLHEFTPAVMHDGRIIYSRWEYVDKAAIPIQSLWTINPDGTMLAAYYGNRVLTPATFFEARPVPGTDNTVVCTFAPHNGPARGEVGTVNPIYGNDRPASMRRVTRSPKRYYRLCGGSDGPDGPFETPFPIDEQRYLVSENGTVVMGDLSGTWRSELIPSPSSGRTARYPVGLAYYSPMPLRARPRPPVRASLLPREPADSTQGQAWASMYIQDVYEGLTPIVRRGEVCELAVVEERAKATSAHDRSRGRYAYQLVAISAGATYAPKKVWGYAKVHEDGSAYFKVPANTPIYLIALDKEGRDVQRMRSFTHLQPGEIQGCIGCHEPRNSAPPPRAQPRAVAGPAQPLVEPPWGVRGFAFIERVQPVLDRRCVSCHKGPKPAGGKDLTGEPAKEGGKLFSKAYMSLLGPKPKGDIAAGKKPFNAWAPTNNGQEWTIRRTAPKVWGSCNSRLADMILADHPDKDGKPRVKLTDAEKRVFLTWIDLNSPYYGSFKKEPKICKPACETAAIK
jgi:hypothetical protein